MAIKTYSESIWLPKDSQIVPNSYQIRVNAVGDYSTPMSETDLETVHGFTITPSNYVYARNPETEYTDFLLESGLNGVTYNNNDIIYLKFKVVYPNAKEVFVVFIVKTGGVPA